MGNTFILTAFDDEVKKMIVINFALTYFNLVFIMKSKIVTFKFYLHNS